MAQADVCDVLLSSEASADALSAELDAGADPDQTCAWTVQVPLLSTLEGLPLLLAGPVGIFVGIGEKRSRARSAAAMKLALMSGRRDLVEPLILAGAGIASGPRIPA